jgi:hypothetical protein
MIQVYLYKFFIATGTILVHVTSYTTTKYKKGCHLEMHVHGTLIQEDES